MEDIADEYGITKQAVSSLLQRMGITVSEGGKAWQMAHKPPKTDKLPKQHKCSRCGFVGTDDNFFIRKNGKASKGLFRHIGCYRQYKKY